VFNSFYQIIKNTFRESVREPIYLIILLTTLVGIGIFPAFTLYSFHEQTKLVTDTAMAAILFFGLITAVLCASHGISNEINNGTALLLLSKPVQRPTFIISKIVGIILTLAVFCFLTSIACLISIRTACDEFHYGKNIMIIYFIAIILSCIIGGVQNYLSNSSFTMGTTSALILILPITLIIVITIPNKGDLFFPKAPKEFFAAITGKGATIDYKNLIYLIYAILTAYIAGIIIRIKSSLNYFTSTMLALLIIVPIILCINLFNLSATSTPFPFWDLSKALILVSFAVFAMAGLATALSTRLDLVANLSICAIILLAGLVSDYLFGLKAQSNILTKALYAIIPNWQKFWLVDALSASNVTIPISYMLYSGIYLILLLTMFILLAIWLFKDREVGNQTMQ